MKHIGLKITALLFAIALWLYVMSLNTFQVTMDVPVRLVKLPEVLAIASIPPQTLTVTLEGEAFDLMRLKNRVKNGDSTVAAIHQFAKCGARLKTHTDRFQKFLKPFFSQYQVR